MNLCKKKSLFRELSREKRRGKHFFEEGYFWLFLAKISGGEEMNTARSDDEKELNSKGGGRGGGLMEWHDEKA